LHHAAPCSFFACDHIAFPPLTPRCVLVPSMMTPWFSRRRVAQREDVEPLRPRKHQPRHVVCEHFAREKHLEAPARMRPGWEWNERGRLQVSCRCKRSLDEDHECARLRGAFRRGVIQIRMGMKQPRATRLASVCEHGPVSPQSLQASRHLVIALRGPALQIQRSGPADAGSSWKAHETA